MAIRCRMPAYQPSAGSSAEANISSFPGQGMYDPSSFLQVLSKNSNILKYFSVKSHQGRSPFQPAIAITRKIIIIVLNKRLDIEKIL
jgi:hypothetical protein